MRAVLLFLPLALVACDAGVHMPHIGKAKSTAVHFVEGEAGAGRGFISINDAKKADKEVKCLATMVYGEARGEPEHGMIAVAWTAMNRATKKPICDVVLAPKQYSVFNDNPTLRMAAMSLKVEPRQKNVIDQAGWQQSLRVARAVYQRTIADPTQGATHYVADKVMKEKGYIYPQWTRQYTQVAIIENHRFFKPFYPGRKT